MWSFKAKETRRGAGVCGTKLIACSRVDHGWFLLPLPARLRRDKLSPQSLKIGHGRGDGWTRDFPGEADEVEVRMGGENS